MDKRVKQAVRDLIAWENRPLDEGPIDKEMTALLARIK